MACSYSAVIYDQVLVFNSVINFKYWFLFFWYNAFDAYYIFFLFSPSIVFLNLFSKYNRSCGWAEVVDSFLTSTMKIGFGRLIFQNFFKAFKSLIKSFRFFTFSFLLKMCNNLVNATGQVFTQGKGQV